jgi:hypothetical protein
MSEVTKMGLRISIVAANYIGDSDKSSTYFDRFKAFCDNSWDIETFCKNKLRKQ